MQDEAEEVKGIMLDNLNKANERSGKLSELNDRADQLHEKSKGFAKTTGKVKKQKRWEHIKTKAMLGGILAAVVVVIVVVVIVMTSSGSDSSSLPEEHRSQTTNSTSDP
ncbi:hypothetical protein JZ751_001614 [Albula glossodonta]|nr:hypothetical protein JZ751_001614 [Albula glossodonta]